MLLHVQLDGSERVVALTEFEELVRNGQVGPETPVRAEVLTQDVWVPASTLEFYRALQSSPEALVRRAWSNPGIPWFTALLVGVELRIFLWTHYTVVQGALVSRWGNYTPSIVERGELDRLLSYGFLHGSIDHVGMNLLFIAYIGLALESVIGSLNLAVLFFGSVFWGGVLSAMLSPSSTSIGASAGDFGYLAAAAVFGLRWLDLLPVRARPRFGFVMLIYVLYIFLNGVLSGQPIDNWAHFGGLLFGAIHMSLLRPNVGTRWRAFNRRASITGVVLMFVGAVAVTRVPIPLVAVEEDGLAASRPVWWATGWSAVGERAWSSPVQAAGLVIRTSRADGPTDAVTEAAALVDDYRGIDPLTVVRGETAISRDGVAGRRLQLAYERDDALRVVEAEVYARGHFVHRVILDLPFAAGRVTHLAERVFASVKLPVPKEVADARAASGGWRAALQRADREAGIGEVETARTLVDGARKEAPNEPATAEALLDLLAEYPTPETRQEVDALLAAFPDDRRVRAAAVHALLEAELPEEAWRRLDEALRAAPGDRRLERLRAELIELTGEPPDPLPPPAPRPKK